MKRTLRSDSKRMNNQSAKETAEKEEKLAKVMDEIEQYEFKIN